MLFVCFALCMCAADPMSVESPDPGLADSGKDSPVGLQMSTDDSALPVHQPTPAVIDTPTANTV